MKKFLSLALVAFSAQFFLQAQTIRRPVASDYTGLGAYSTTHTDAFSFISNQASLAQIKKFTAGIYSERRFMLNELNLYNAVIALRTRSGSFGLKGAFYGFAGYNETQLGLAYGRSLGSKIDLGVQFSYYGMKVVGYGNAAAFGFEAGIIMHVSDKINAGVQVSNPVGGKFGKNAGEKLPFVYTTGLGYEASDKFLISMEMEKEEDQPVNVNAGLQYRLLPRLRIRAGISTATSNMWLGVGVMIKSMRVDITAGYHPQLGVTPGLLLMVPADIPTGNEESEL